MKIPYETEYRFTLKSCFQFIYIIRCYFILVIFVCYFFFLKMSCGIENYDYSFMINLYEAICSIPGRENYPIETLHAIETLEDACDLQICDKRSLLWSLNGGYEFYTPLECADFLANRVRTIYNECPDLSLCPGLETLMSIVREREEVRAEHKDIPYFFFLSCLHHN